MDIQTFEFYFKALENHGAGIITLGIMIYLYLKRENERDKQIKEFTEFQRGMLETLALIRDSIANNYANAEVLRLFVIQSWSNLVYLYKSEMGGYIIKNNLVSNISNIKLELTDKVEKEFIKLEEELRQITNEKKVDSIIGLFRCEVNVMRKGVIELLESFCETYKQESCFEHSKYTTLTRQINAHIENVKNQAISKINDLIL